MTLAPLMPPDVDLRDFSFMPIDIVRLFGSDFHAQSTDAEWRAGMTLWLKSFHQVPAGSIPDSDIALARLAEFGRDATGWKEVKNGALHGWKLCSDGRWYHSVVCEKALEGWIGKLLQRRSGAAGNAKRWNTAADLSEVDRQISEAAEALQKLAPGSSILRKCRPSQAAASGADEPQGGAGFRPESQPDRDPMPVRSQPDRDPIAEGSQEKGRGKIERESRESATMLSDPVNEPRNTPNRRRSPKALIAWPDDFALTQDLRAYATKHGFDADWLFEKFRNKALSKGWTYRDWPAAFRNFAQSEQTYASPSRSNGARQDQAWRPPDV